MRVRCSQVVCLIHFLSYLIMQHINSTTLILIFCQGIQVQEYYGNFCKSIPTDVDLPGVSVIF